MTSTGTNPIWGECFFWDDDLAKKKKRCAAKTIEILVVKTRLQLSARKKETGAISTKSGSFLPKPIAASAASLASQTSTPVSTAAVSAAASAAATRTLPRSNLTPAFSMTMDIIKKEGIRGLYRGLSASYLGVSEGVIQWVLYEVSRSFLFSSSVLCMGADHNLVFAHCVSDSND